MTSDTNRPSNAAIREACRRADAIANAQVVSTEPPSAILLAAQLIEKYEPETLIDPVVKRAREICAAEEVEPFKEGFSSGRYDTSQPMKVAIRALKEGMNP